MSIVGLHRPQQAQSDEIMYDITASAHDAIVVSAVISIGKSLKHSMIAARVEIPEQLTFLQAPSFSRIEDNVQVRALQLRGNRWRS